MKDIKQAKYCNCSAPCDKNILKPNINHSFCQNCGSILLKDYNKNIYYTLKAKQNINKIEFSPIDIILSMKNKTEAEYPYINREYNINNIEKWNKENLLKSINLYLKHRKMIISNLQKLMKSFDFSDLIFYQTLFYIDNYLSHHMSEEITEKTILYYLVGYFLCSAKSKETDLSQPSLDSFCSLQKKIYLTLEKISYYEVKCLQSIDYNIFSYTVYDWITELLSIGIIFDCEINKNNYIILINGHRHHIINAINKKIMIMLLNITTNNLFIKYSPMFIAFSLIQIAREEYLDKNYIKHKLFIKLINLYGVNFNDYKKCYLEIKENIKKKENKNENGVFDQKIVSHYKKLKIINPEDITLANNINQNKNSSILKKFKFKSSMELPFLELNKNNIKNEEKEKEVNNNDIIKNENIVFKDESNEKKENNNIGSESKLTFDLDNEAHSKLKIKSSKDINHIKIKNKKLLFINYNNIAYKSDENLPIINLTLEQNLSQFSNKEKNEKNYFFNFKYSSSNNNPKKDISLKTDQKFFNSIKNKNNLNSLDNKRLCLANFNSKSNYNFFKKKREINSLKHYFFYFSNNQKKIDNNEKKVIIKNINIMRSEFPSKITNLNNLIKKDIKDNNSKEEKYKYNNNYNYSNYENNLIKRNKSKSKYKNNLMGKEVKEYFKDRRNKSITFKKRI